MDNFKLNKKVLVAMSGGVDSSVAAALLKEQGYEVIGATIIMWPSYALRASEGKPSRGCCGIDAAEDAKKVCAVLGVPHYTLNFRDYFKQTVIDDFCLEYKKGRTPNPCIRCNRLIKFGKFWQKARELGCEFMATGHYTKIMTNDECRMTNECKYKLYKGKDKSKDQSYVLYMMNQESLAHTLYPLGELTKAEVRKLAKKLKLPVHDKAESQEICFIEDDDYGRFLKEECPEVVKPGKIVDVKGQVVGEHNGAAFYTLGQRKGIGSHRGQPKYVIKIDPQRNLVVIGDDKSLLSDELIAENLSFVSGQMPTQPLEITAKIRYNSREAEAVLTILKDKDKEQDKAKVIFKQPQRAITPGQSVVFYKGDEVIGGGIISK